MSEHYTDLVVGAGSSGAVIAARLSDDADRRVLLVEAGPDVSSDDLPADIRDGLRPSFLDHDWGYTAEAVPGRSIAMARGKVVGGCSATNTALAVRPDPRDFADWTAFGLTGWTWEDMFPYFLRIEDDQDFRDELHGAGGPIPVRRWRTDELIPLQRALLEACLEQGHPWVADHNLPGATGIGPLPQNLRDGLRVSTAIAYLDPVRHRPNLEIRPDTLVDRVIVEAGRAVGVRVLTGVGQRTITADRVVLSAGAIGSPTILLRSGIGPASDLAKLGIAVIADRPGVGRNLQDHPACRVILQPAPGVCDTASPVCQMLLAYTAPGSADFNDMRMYLYSQVDLGGHATRLLGSADDAVVFMLSVGIESPRSRGSLTLTSANPVDQPKIDLNYLSDPEDLRRLREGVRYAWQLAQHPEIQRHATRTVAPDKATVDSDAELDEFLFGSVTTHDHPVGTARMGLADNRNAVVDDRCRVHGVPNLLVADASIMPTIPHANTNLTCIAIGERVADWLVADSLMT